VKFLNTLCLVVGLAGVPQWAVAVDINGIKVEESVDLKGSKLALNGAGTRYKGPFKVYVAGLYTAKKAGTLEEVIGQPGAKRLHATMVRDIDANELGKLLYRGVEDNMGKADMSKLVPGLLKMSELFSAHKNLRSGDTFTIDWVPGTGTLITVKGKIDGDVFKEPEFFKALMSIWLGPVPADFKLKDALLGIKG
jgi:Chalcone isomerase-like